MLQLGIYTISTLLQLYTRSLFTAAFPKIPQPPTLWWWIILLSSSLHQRPFRQKTSKQRAHFPTQLLISAPNTPFLRATFHLQRYSNHQHDPRAMLVPVLLALVVIGAAVYWFINQEKRVQLNPRQYQKFKLIFKKYVLKSSPYYLSIFCIDVDLSELNREFFAFISKLWLSLQYLRSFAFILTVEDNLAISLDRTLINTPTNHSSPFASSFLLFTPYNFSTLLSHPWSTGRPH